MFREKGKCKVTENRRRRKLRYIVGGRKVGNKGEQGKGDVEGERHATEGKRAWLDRWRGRVIDRQVESKRNRWM